MVLGFAPKLKINQINWDIITKEGLLSFANTKQDLDAAFSSFRDYVGVKAPKYYEDADRLRAVLDYFRVAANRVSKTTGNRFFSHKKIEGWSSVMFIYSLKKKPLPEMSEEEIKLIETQKLEAKKARLDLNRQAKDLFLHDLTERVRPKAAFLHMDIAQLTKAIHEAGLVLSSEDHRADYLEKIHAEVLPFTSQDVEVLRNRLSHIKKSIVLAANLFKVSKKDLERLEDALFNSNITEASYKNLLDGTIITNKAKAIDVIDFLVKEVDPSATKPSPDNYYLDLPVDMSDTIDSLLSAMNARVFPGRPVKEVSPASHFLKAMTTPTHAFVAMGLSFLFFAPKFLPLLC